jgi:hypothetical protein
MDGVGRTRSGRTGPVGGRGDMSSCWSRRVLLWCVYCTRGELWEHDFRGSSPPGEQFDCGGRLVESGDRVGENVDIGSDWEWVSYGADASFRGRCGGDCVVVSWRGPLIRQGPLWGDTPSHS